eukprot:TRINITY_DN8739_c0_g1_i1.p1 TRINITY_DN8739_c0_g1~~TRINITY_DN8739_c0_g1_i1.p1  ORF type:complete len:324 (+),score=-10.69 TRINITY_DN8739_c0_g1_i1:42-974(+)
MYQNVFFAIVLITTTTRSNAEENRPSCENMTCVHGGVCVIGMAGRAVCLPEGDPCEWLWCPEGTHCEINADTNTPKLICAISLDDDKTDPCSYTKCPNGTICENLQGEALCTQEVSNPCNDISCPGPFTACVVDKDNIPVCAGRSDLCPTGTHPERFHQSDELVCVADEGPCSKLVCASGTHCVVDSQFSALCVESDSEVDPCSGVTCPADTECEYVRKQVVCVPERDLCSGFVCPSETICAVDPFGRATCVLMKVPVSFFDLHGCHFSIVVLLGASGVFMIVVALGLYARLVRNTHVHAQVYASDIIWV